MWNLWGWTCVVVQFKNGGVLRIGTDDAENLVEFLNGKIGEQADVGGAAKLPRHG